MEIIGNGKRGRRLNLTTRLKSFSFLKIKKDRQKGRKEERKC